MKSLALTQKKHVEPAMPVVPQSVSTARSATFSSTNLSNRSKSTVTMNCGVVVSAPMTFTSTNRGSHNLYMDGYTYQIKSKLKLDLKWWCLQNRNGGNCPALIYTSHNSGDNDRPSFDFCRATGIHNHKPDRDKQIIQGFVDNLKKQVKDPNSAPTIRSYNQLAGTMKLTDEQIQKLPSYDKISKWSGVVVVVSSLFEVTVCCMKVIM